MLQKNPGMGKTAVMKAMFMLQQVKGLSLGCDFSIYTYGPYAAEIMEDIDELLSEGGTFFRNLSVSQLYRI